MVLNQAQKWMFSRHRRRRVIAVFVVVFCSVTLTTTSLSASPHRSKQAQKILDRWTKRAKLKGLKLGVSMKGLGGKLQAKNRATELSNPASGTKLLTTAAALMTWKLDKRFTTRVHGQINAHRTNENGLCIVGAGDPKLLSDDLESIADRLQDKGLKHIDGPILIDTSIFKGKNLPPAYAQKSTTSGYRSSTGALGVDYGAITLAIKSVTKSKKPTVTLDSARGYAVLENLSIHQNGKKNELTYTLKPLPDGRMKVTIEGKLGRRHPKFTHRLRMLDPNLGAAHIFRKLLTNRNVTVKGPIKIVGKEACSFPLLVEHQGPPLRVLLKDLNTYSNNFMAETVFRHLGKRWKESQIAVSKSLESLGLQADTFKVINGSGLYKATTITPDSMVHLLASIANRKGLSKSFKDTLAVSGRPGTLKRRLRGRMRGLVQGKTGTLNEVVSLSGYLTSRHSGVLAFAIFINDATPDRTASIRREIDRLLRSWSRL